MRALQSRPPFARQKISNQNTDGKKVTFRPELDNYFGVEPSVNCGSVLETFLRVTGPPPRGEEEVFSSSVFVLGHSVVLGQFSKNMADVSSLTN